MNAWEATQWRWSTSSALGFEATQWRWSTTSSDYWLTQQNVSAFSTTSADYWDTTKIRWATTSSDYWKSVNNFFSTTSANAWEATQWRWATTSANYFESTQWRWATSSSNNAVNVFINGSTTIPKTFSANTFTALQTFGAAASTSALTISNIQNGILSTNATGGVVATTSIGTNYLAGTLGVGQGGTGSTTLTGILKGNGTGYIQTAIAGTDYLTGSGLSGNCVKWGPNYTLTDFGTTCGGGGGGAGGTWATSTSPVANELFNYPNFTTDIVLIGGTATETAAYFFDPNTHTSYFSGKTTLTYASSTGLSVSGSTWLTGLQGKLLSTDQNGLVSATTSIGTNYLSGTLGVGQGGTGSTTLGGILTGNGTGALTSATIGGGLSFSANTLSLVSTGDWTGTFDGQEGSFYLASSFSTTSADWWKSNRNFFSTTSADAWDATKWRWATTSANYFEVHAVALEHHFK